MWACRARGVTEACCNRHVPETIARKHVAMLSVENMGIHSIRLAPAEEKRLAGDGYYFLLLRHGQVYWLDDNSNAILEPGNLVVVPRGGERYLRSGRFEESVLVGFVLCPFWLEGLLTLKEKMLLENWLNSLKYPHFIQRDHAAAQFLSVIDSVDSLGDPSELPARIKALEVLALLLGEIKLTQEDLLNGRALTSCEARMRRFFDALTVLELRALSLERVAESCGCSSRHAGRVFRRCFGSSFRTKQTDIRMEKAAALLADGEMAVESVAETCGFGDGQSLGLAFRRRYGVSPREWARSKGARSKAQH